MSRRLTSHTFRQLLRTIADGWNTGDARRSAACFAEDAIYLEPPNKQLHRGRAALYQFFGADSPPPMDMRWHHIVFDADSQVGVGEYTFQGKSRYHGVVIVQLEEGLIARWREYQYTSELDWEVFVGESHFVDTDPEAPL